MEKPIRLKFPSFESENRIHPILSFERLMRLILHRNHFFYKLVISPFSVALLKQSLIYRDNPSKLVPLEGHIKGRIV